MTNPNRDFDNTLGYPGEGPLSEPLSDAGRLHDIPLATPLNISDILSQPHSGHIVCHFNNPSNHAWDELRMLLSILHKMIPKTYKPQHLTEEERRLCDLRDIETFNMHPKSRWGSARKYYIIELMDNIRQGARNHHDTHRQVAQTLHNLQACNRALNHLVRELHMGQHYNNNAHQR